MEIEDIASKIVADPRGPIADILENEKLQTGIFAQLECPSHEEWHKKDGQ